MYSKLAFFAALAALTNLASAHMIMKTPNPYGADSLNNSPLNTTQGLLDYPCKTRPGGYNPPVAPNQMPVGAAQTLSFTGSAVHGGGSCQISLSTDKEPTPSSTFKVIHSIVGGCPSNKTEGNLDGGPSSSGANTYGFSIPNDVPNGDYALAWTWFNKVGNREMYMNCAPVTVSGSTGSPDSFNKLPNMFIANCGGVSASTSGTEGNDIKFPNPGPSVETDGAAGDKFMAPNCPPETNGCTIAPQGGQSGAAPASPGAAGAPAAGAGAAPQPQSSAGAQGPAATPGQNAVAAVPDGATPAAAAGSPPASPAAGAAGGASSPPAAGGASGGGGGACPAGASPCQSPGSVVCLPNSSFGICDQNMCAVAQQLASGTSCNGGVISKRDATRYNSPLLRARHEHEHATAKKHHI